ncbi:lytic transglycosylase domain-containing protein [Allonocardiopsis opalescens]|uniref:Membrane-bound lytic murein transglycosylase B n=1 Tax=Allonocardiopsis opalescens TaxID=1144618 RepID=A0A2T0QDP3_9ACTN|nr:lytic murein transglycosylase [Allonocardiopsis opalescens]PRY02012.1 membrane-bound lytic murein transglycosylase B [Allonocardiopsis opalescens]
MADLNDHFPGDLHGDPYGGGGRPGPSVRLAAIAAALAVLAAAAVAVAIARMPAPASDLAAPTVIPGGYDLEGVYIGEPYPQVAGSAPASAASRAPGSQQAGGTGALSGGPGESAPAPTEEAPGVLPRLDQGWIAEVSARTGVPERALQAYAGAHLWSEGALPGCRLTWTTLAGIGQIETRHGTFGGGEIDADGDTTVPILGPQLDGDGFAAIGDSDGGVLDGDTEWDRAVGPMQFIPGTWRSWGTDADGDGRADPHNIDDAAVSAARYLCADGRDMSTVEGWQSAVLSYNNSGEYVTDVLETANGYASAAG